jgi:putative phosphoribosyl transferase
MDPVSAEYQPEREIVIPIGGASLHGTLSIPRNAVGVVLFAHGSGSGRFSPRNRSVARTLNESGIATLLMDLLSEAEEIIDTHTRHLRFDIKLLTERLLSAVQWLSHEPVTERLPVGLFGASTGAAAAISTAVRASSRVGAVVSRGGRVDLAGSDLKVLRCPVLFIVGGRDREVLELNERAIEAVGSRVKRLAVVPGAGHLFEEPGTLLQVSRLTAQWFRLHLRAS